MISEADHVDIDEKLEAVLVDDAEIPLDRAEGRQKIVDGQGGEAHHQRNERDELRHRREGCPARVVRARRLAHEIRS